MIKQALAVLLTFGYLMASSFNYDLHITSLPGKNDKVMICFHGYGDSYEFISYLHELKYTDSTLVSFNFPDYGINQGREYDPKKASFGTIDELLSPLYVLKKTILERGLEQVDLYGFSAGGGALINVLALLNTTTYDKKLQKIGIDTQEKKQILSAIEKGTLILDAPLKSIEEIIACRGSTEEFKILANNYKTNNLRPIDSIKRLQGLKLNLVLFFQKNDEVLSNRDDDIFISRLKKALPTSDLTIITSNDGGHAAPHPSLWKSISH